MSSIVNDILGQSGAIARRLGKSYEARPQQLEMAEAVVRALDVGEHLVVEAGTGVGKSFAYLVPAVDYVIRTKKRVVISTHTIALQEQLVEKDIPLIRSVYPDEFSAVLVKGRGNYLCRRRLDQARARQYMLFDNDRQIESLNQIESWAQDTHDGSLTALPVLPDPSVWEKVNAEQGNCMGKRCRHYEACHWQAAKRRMQTGQLLIVNHALFFSDLALRMAGVNYLPKYDAVIFDEAHTLEDVAGQHFGMRLSDSSVKYQLRALYDPKRGSGVLSSHGAVANEAIKCVVGLADEVDTFFDRIASWQESHGRANGRIHEAGVVPDTLSPRLNDLTKYLKEMLPRLEENEEAIGEIGNLATRVSGMADTIEVMIKQSMPDAVYWFDVAKRTPRRVSMHAAPIDVAEGLRQQLFSKVPRVILTSATLATAAEGKKKSRQDAFSAKRGTGFQPVSSSAEQVQRRQGAYLPHWTKPKSIYAVTFRLADSLPQHLASVAPSTANTDGAMHPNDETLDRGLGECWLGKPVIAESVVATLNYFRDERYKLLAWCVMPNHVHLLIEPIAGHELPQIIHSIKRHSAKACNALLARDGAFWQSEYYDHLVRDERDLRFQAEYVWNNSDKVNLENWPFREIDVDTIDLATFGEKDHGLETRATEDRNTASAAAPPSPDARFAFIQQRLGIDKAVTLHLGSPFDYANQAVMYIENELPDPNDTLRFLPAACEKILQYLDLTSGGAFVLFTSYRMLIDAANALKHRIEGELGLPLLVQGQHMPRKQLLDEFRARDNAVLFGTSSFWQGIDVQGEKLRNVIIVKLPFAVPDEPLLEAKLDAIRRTGGNPFMDLQVPEAIIKLKQGFGRLIRSRTDKGIVVLLDNRVRSKRYGSLFLESLPPCKVVDVT